MNNNILILGNGFDLYHYLPTKYTDFLEFVGLWPDFLMKYKEFKHDSGKQCKIPLKNEERELGSYIFELASNPNFYIAQSSIDYLNEKLTKNICIKYFKRIQKIRKNSGNWIDFEGDFQNALEMIEELFESLFDSVESISDRRLNDDIRFLMKLFKDNKDIKSLQQIIKENKLSPMEKQQQKELVIKSLRESFDIFAECFRLYLVEFVSKFEPSIYSSFIHGMSWHKVINFNYTHTFRDYYLHDSTEEMYVHGETDSKNIVFGISDDFFDENAFSDYIRFQKFYKRIRINTCIDYFEWVQFDKEPTNETEIDEFTPYVYVFGHSLDKTDKSIFEFFIKNETCFTVLYVREYGYEQQLQNLISVFGREKIIDLVARKRLCFREISEGEDIATINEKEEKVKKKELSEMISDKYTLI